MKSHNHQNRQRGSALLVVLAVVALFGAVTALVPPPGGKGSSWLAPKTWTSHKAADKVDTAVVAVANSNNQVIHAAHVEGAKLGEVLGSVPPSPATDLAKRFSSNQMSLLGQVDTVTVQEVSDLRALVLDMLSKDAVRVANAEARQATAEHANGQLSEQNKQLHQQLVQAQANLRADAEEKIAAYNELETEHAHKIILIVLVVLALGLAAYFRSNLAAVGSVFHEAQKSMPSFDGLVSQLDGKLGALGQWAVRTGKHAAADAEIKLKAKAEQLAARMRTAASGATAAPFPKP